MRRKVISFMRLLIVGLAFGAICASGSVIHYKHQHNLRCEEVMMLEQSQARVKTELGVLRLRPETRRFFRPKWERDGTPPPPGWKKE